MRLSNRFVSVAGIVALLSFVGISGCTSGASATLGDRTVSATCKPLAGVAVWSKSDSAEFRLSHHTVRVTEKEVSWDKDKTLQLPAKWKLVELRESDDQIVILVDGAHFGVITQGTNG